MKKGIAAAFAVVVLAAALVGCSGNTGSSSGTGASSSSASSTPQVTIKTSPDKYTWYVKNYVGMNASSVGYTALDGMRHDKYGAGVLDIVLVTPSGEYIDPEDDAALGNYYVVGQSLEPNTELKYTFETDSEGKEYDSLVNWKNHDEIVLSVNHVGDKSNTTVGLTAIQAAPDKYTNYVRDYTGRNLASCGYVSLAEKLTDQYGSGYVKFDITADDGSLVDLTIDDDSMDDEQKSAARKAMLSQYVVVSQSVAPNTPITFTFVKDSKGEEYSNLVDYQSVESINLVVKKVDA